MGGPGSGYYLRFDSKQTVESMYDIDIRWMKKRGLLEPGTISKISWSINGEETGSVGFQVTKSRMILNYRNQHNGGEWEDIEDEIFFTWTGCNYGGKRQWFLCPGCHRRVAIIYGGKYFRCRHCHDLTYACQQESPPFRLTRKAQKIRKRLGASLCTSDPITEKPKYMHWKTFERLRNEAYRATEKAYEIMYTSCGSFLW